MEQKNFKSHYLFKGELNPKIKFVLFERTLASFLRYFSFFDMQITHMTLYGGGMTYRRMLYIYYINAIIKRNNFEVIMCVCFSHDTKHVHFEVISFYNSKDIYITFSNMSFPVYYVICVICISKKLKYLKNEARESKTER